MRRRGRVREALAEIGGARAALRRAVAAEIAQHPATARSDAKCRAFPDRNPPKH